MYILNLRTTRWFLTALAVFIFVVLLGLRFYEPVYSYEKENVVFWSWEDVALSKGLSYGPQGFAVSGDGGKIALADTYNGRIVLLEVEEGRQEQFVFSPKPVFSSLTFDRQGNLYALAFGTNDVLSLKDMNWIEVSKEIGTHPYYQAEAIEVGKRIYVQQIFISDEVYEVSLISFDLEGQEEKILHRAQLKEGSTLLVGPMEIVQKPVNSFTIDLRDNVYLESQGRDPFSREINIVSSSGEKRNSFIYHSAEYIRDCNLWGIDEAGNIYMAINPGRGNGQIVVLSNKGDVLSVIPVTWSEEYMLSDYGTVDSEGNIYFLLADEDGLYVEKLVAHKEWALKK